LIVIQGERSGQILLRRREVVTTNQIQGEGMAVGSQILEQTAEAE
jgi:hypothetical protein